MNSKVDPQDFQLATRKVRWVDGETASLIELRKQSMSRTQESGLEFLTQ